MRWLALAMALAVAACKHGGGQGSGGADELAIRAAMADDDEPPPSYGKAELSAALIAERAAEAAAERRIAELEAGGDPEPVHAAKVDLAVRRRFIAMLELCEAVGRFCPPRLDDPAWAYAVDSEADPPLDTPLRFDLATWPQVAAELHGRACACRTLACIDSLGAAIDRLETRSMPEVQADDAATAAITRARKCLFHLRGRRALPRLVVEAEP